MTIFEMLEKLETEIVSLRARCQDLANSQHHSQSNGNGRPASGTKRSGVRKKGPTTKAAVAPSARSKRKAESSSKRAAAQQLELQVAEAATPEEQPGPKLGKRQALGKSLVQLRKMSAWRSGHSSGE